MEAGVCIVVGKDIIHKGREPKLYRFLKTSFEMYCPLTGHIRKMYSRVRTAEKKMYGKVYRHI